MAFGIWGKKKKMTSCHIRTNNIETPLLECSRSESENFNATRREINVSLKIVRFPVLRVNNGRFTYFFVVNRI